MLVLVAVLLLEHLHHRRVGQGGGVAQRTTLGNVAQEPAHDLAAAGLGQLGGEVDVVGMSDTLTFEPVLAGYACRLQRFLPDVRQRWGKANKDTRTLGQLRRWQVRDRISTYGWSTGVTDMELFEPILGMTMIVVGLIMLFGSIGFLLYGIWTSGKSKPDAST